MSGNKKRKKDVFNFEKSLALLEEKVRSLESGELTLEDSLKAFEDGVGLVKSCRDYLEEARIKVEVLLGEEDGSPIIEPYEEDVEDEDDEEEEDED